MKDIFVKLGETHFNIRHIIAVEQVNGNWNRTTVLTMSGHTIYVDERVENVMKTIREALA